MNNAVYEYEINETLKVSLYYDEWNYSVYDALGEGFGVYMINRRFSNHDAGDLANEIEAVTLGVDIARDAKVTGRYDDQLNEALGKMFKRQNRSFMLVTLSNYREATLAVIYALEPEDNITYGLAQAMDAWFKGEIYTLALEELAIYTNLANGDTLKKWEVKDSIGCMMIDDFKEVEELAADYFDIPKKEEAA